MHHFPIGLRRTKSYQSTRTIYHHIKRVFNDCCDFLIDMGFIRRTLRQTILKRKISRMLIRDFGGDRGHNINKSQYFIGFGLVHYSLVRNTRPRRILCIGSRKGFMPAILALACQDNQFGHVDFVDPGYDRREQTKNWSGIGLWKKINPQQYFKSLGITSKISVYVMRSVDFAKKYPHRKYQYIYVDGDHSYEGVKLDYNIYWPRVEKGGFMAFHDVIVTGYVDRGKYGIWRFWKEIDKKHTIMFPFPKISGLGIVQKK